MVCQKGNRDSHIKGKNNNEISLTLKMNRIPWAHLLRQLVLAYFNIPAK
ncbi:hypothetical protein BLGI_1988 [Brevibacillus laterosporus GI-9]|nr:hypothetical protein BLGI_1988 [Brevibacillus laterosporus GI-9]